MLSINHIAGKISRMASLSILQYLCLDCVERKIQNWNLKIIQLNLKKLKFKSISIFGFVIIQDIRKSIVNCDTKDNSIGRLLHNLNFLRFLICNSEFCREAGRIEV